MIKKPEQYIIQRGKKLAFLLRHDRSYPFVDAHGWRDLLLNTK